MKFFKRAGAAALAIILSAGMLTAGAAYEDLTDEEAIVNKEAVQTLVELGVLDGRDDGSFDPAGTLTRQEGAKIISMLLCGGDFNAVATDAVYFTDVSDAWGLAYINYVAQLGIMGGHGDGTFTPDAPLTANQLAKMLLVALGEDNSNFIGDDWYKKVEVFAARYGLTADMEAADLNAPISRDNMAQMVYLALDATSVGGATLRQLYFGESTESGETQQPVKKNGYVLIDPEKTAIRYSEAEGGYVYDYNVYYADGSAATIRTSADILTCKVYLLKDGYMSDETCSGTVCGIYGSTVALDTDATPGADTYISLAEGCAPVLFAQGENFDVGAQVVYATDTTGYVVGIWVVG